VLTGEALDGMEAECRRIWRESQEQRTGYRLVMQGALDRILIEAVRSTGARESAVSRPADPRQKIGRALTYIHHHFREPLTLAQAACQARLSPHYFSECFHAATGVPFQRYLSGLRLRFACSLLAVSDAAITDLCLASGFSSLSNFERAFKARYGRSPRAYRAHIKEAG
jgi:transcriptional regulator GlxA family with amidase domain